MPDNHLRTTKDAARRGRTERLLLVDFSRSNQVLLPRNHGVYGRFRNTQQDVLMADVERLGNSQVLRLWPGLATPASVCLMRRDWMNPSTSSLSERRERSGSLKKGLEILLRHVQCVLPPFRIALDLRPDRDYVVTRGEHQLLQVGLLLVKAEEERALLVHSRI